ncbi:MAG TPA: UDP-N-acetylmuramoyl-tripeptide--D-alanyl-D-alanine ligase [Nitrospirota bacterium]|jgi:UDP-N-acetylmuramoyl-tripeptide--D-alanyl-D-alanine ligase
MKLRTQDILNATGGKEIYECPPAFEGITTDSRKAVKGGLFVPLIGEKFDGHEFIAQAFEAGASGTVVKYSHPVLVPSGMAIIEVGDTLKALQNMARYFRAKRPDLKVVGITGTNGKTTTKEMLASILGVNGPVLKTEGNLNNHIGLPLTIMKLEKEQWAAVIEMGMSGFGEIKLLAGIAAPQVGIITNIGPAHLDSLGDMAGVARAKGELIEALPEDGRAVLNLDDPFMASMIESNRERAYTFGLNPDADFSASDIKESLQGVYFKMKTPAGSVPVSLPVMGGHNVYNALAASAAAHALGIGLEGIKGGLEGFTPAKMRMEVVATGGITVINDAYNANPASMAAALTALASVKEGRKVAVLGDMKELGASADKAHCDLGRLAGADNLALLVAVGEYAGLVARGAAETGMAVENIFELGSAEEAGRLLSGKLRDGDTVLVKGSRAMGMERVVELIRNRRPAA